MKFRFLVFAIPAVLPASALPMDNPPQPSPAVLVNQPWLNEDPAWDASVWVDISSEYDYRGLVLRHSWLESCSTTLNIQGAYRPAPTWELLASWNYRSIDDGDDPWDEELQKLHDLDGQILHTKNETQLQLAARKFWNNENLSFTGGYRYTYGGFSGLMVQASQRGGDPCLNEFFFDIKRDVFGGDSDSGSNHAYVGVTASYAMGKLSGWWFDLYTAYRFSMCNRLDLETSLHINLASSYWNRTRVTPGNGAQSFVLQVTMPIRIGNHMEVVPFIGGNLLGEGAKKLNDKNTGAPMLRNFSIIGGAGVSYHF